MPETEVDTKIARAHMLLTEAHELIWSLKNNHMGAVDIGKWDNGITQCLNALLHLKASTL